RGYMKHINDIQTGLNVKQIVHRALQISTSQPQGPVYLTGAREIMEEEISSIEDNSIQLNPLAPAALTAADVSNIIRDLLKAKHPLVITSYIGKNKNAVPKLVEFCERMAIPVVESVSSYMNFPSDNKLHGGYQWNAQKQNILL